MPIFIIIRYYNVFNNSENETMKRDRNSLKLETLRILENNYIKKV